MQIKFVVVVDNLFVLTFPFVIFVVYLWGLMRGATVEENIKKGNSIYSYLFLSNPLFSPGLLCGNQSHHQLST